MSGSYQGIEKILISIEGDLPERKGTLLPWFKKARFTDTLLPVPENGLGLPRQLDHPADRQRFLEEQKWAFDTYPVQPGTGIKNYQGDTQHYRVDSLDAVVDDPQGYLNHCHVGSRVIMETCLGRNDQDEDAIVSTYRGRRHKQDKHLKASGGFGSVFQVKIKGFHLAMKLIVRPRSRRATKDPSSSSGSDEESFWPKMEIIGGHGQQGTIGYPEKQQSSFEDEVFILRNIRKLSLADGRLARIRENHIIKIRAAFTDPQAFGILISPVAFFDLHTLLDRISESETGSFSESNPAVTFERSQLLKCMGCLAASVAFLHKSDIRHRDLKPKNVLVVPSDTNSVGWKICLCDFATAVIEPESGRPRRGADTERAVINPMTPDYESPERHFGDPRTISEDMWHLGCIFLEIFIVIKSTTRKALQEIFEEREAKRETELQLYGKSCSKSTFREWLDDRKTDSGESIDFVIDWINDLLLAEGPDYPRMTIYQLLELIHPKSAHGRILFEECCRDFFDCDEVHVREGLVKGDEGVIFCTEIREAKLTPAEYQHFLQPKLLAVISPSMPTFERRLVLCDNAWPFPKHDKLREAWLPVTGIFITRKEELTPRKVIVKWSGFNQHCERDTSDYGQEYWLGFKPWNPNCELDVTFMKADDAVRFISILTSAEHVARGTQPLPIDSVPTKHTFNAQIITIHSLDEDGLHVYNNSVQPSNHNDRMSSEGATPDVSNITQVLTVASGHPRDLASLHFLQDEQTHTRAHMLYFLRSRPQFDFQFHEGSLEIDGFEWITYAKTERRIGLKYTPDEACNLTVAEFKRPERQDLTLHLSTPESSGVDRLCIVSPPASKVGSSEQAFHDMFKEITGWDLLIMCSVAGFDTVRSIRANKPQGPGLLTLWKSETQQTLWLAARLQDSRLGHGTWWYGRVNEIPDMKRHKKKVEVKMVNFQKHGTYFSTENFNHIGRDTERISITFHEEKECIFVGTVKFQ